MSDPKLHDDASRVTDLILDAEEAADKAVAAIAALMVGTVEARRRSGTIAATSQPTLLRLNRALTRVIDGTSDVMRVHGELQGHYAEQANGDLHPYTVEGLARRSAPTVVPLHAVADR
jgi:hypothetical protein